MHLACLNCGSTKSLAELGQTGHRSCCPERDMVPHKVRMAYQAGHYWYNNEALFMAIRAFEEPLRVVAAAHRYHREQSEDPRKVPVIVSAPPPARHHNLFVEIDGDYRPKFEDSGFLLSDGTFADRKLAADVAIAAGQIKESDLIAPPYLYSEDLW